MPGPARRPTPPDSGELADVHDPDRLLDLDRPVPLVYDGSDSSRRSLALALQLKGPQQRGLVVAVPEATSELRREIEDAVRKAPAKTRQVEISTARTAVKLGDLALGRHCGLAILPMGGRHLGVDRVQEILDRIRCPALIVS